MNEIQALRDSLKDTSDVMMGVQLADMAFFEGVVQVLNRLDPAAAATIGQVMSARAQELTKAHHSRVQQVATSRTAAIAAAIRA